MFFVQAETQRVYEVEDGSGYRTGTRYVPRVLRYFRLIKDYVKRQGYHLSQKLGVIFYKMDILLGFYEIHHCGQNLISVAALGADAGHPYFRLLAAVLPPHLGGGHIKAVMQPGKEALYYPAFILEGLGTVYIQGYGGHSHYQDITPFLTFPKWAVFCYYIKKKR